MLEVLRAAGQSVAQAHAEQAAVGDGVDGLTKLIAGVLRVGEGVEPGAHAHLHVAEGAEEHRAAHGDERQADDQVELLARCNVEHEQEHEEEHERAAEVLLQDDDEHGEAPHEQKGQKRADVGKAHGPDAHGEHGEHLAVFRQIACHEQHDEDLGDFSGLEGESADVQPDAAAVNFLAKAGNHGREQKENAHEHERVLVVGDFVQVSKQRQHDDHERHAQE